MSTPAAYRMTPVLGHIVVAASPTSDWGALCAMMPDGTTYMDGIEDLIADHTHYSISGIREILRAIDISELLEIPITT